MVAALDGDDLAGDVAEEVAGDGEGDVGAVVDGGDAAEGRLLDERLRGGGVVGEVDAGLVDGCSTATVGVHGGGDEAGGDGVDAHLVGAVLAGGDLGGEVDGGLGGRVGRQPDGDGDGRTRRYVDEGAAAGGGHGVPHVLHEVDEAEVLDVGDLVELDGGDVADHVAADDAGGVDGDIERAPLVDGGVGEGLQVVVVAAVAANGGGADLGAQLLEVLLAAGGDDELGALLGEALGDGPADAAGSPQDDRLLTVEESHAKRSLPELRATAGSLRRGAGWG